MSTTARYFDELWGEQMAMEYEIGEQVWYAGNWGRDAPVRGTITGAGEENSQPVYDVQLENGCTSWGYAYQFEPYWCATQ